MTDDLSTPHPDDTKPAAWIDLVLYLGIGFGGFLAASYVLGRLVTQYNIATSALVYLLNFTFFFGSVALITWTRKTGLWQEIGFIPVRIPLKWVYIAVGLTLALIPLRAALAALVEILIHGSLDSLSQSARMEIISPSSGPLWLNFLVTLLCGGILAPIAEEIYFRGALYTWFRSRSSMAAAMIFSTALFGLGHFDQISVVVSSVVIGLVNAWLLERTHSIWVPITMHVVNNSAAVLMLYALLAVQQVK